MFKVSGTAGNILKPQSDSIVHGVRPYFGERALFFCHEPSLAKVLFYLPATGCESHKKSQNFSLISVSLVLALVYGFDSESSHQGSPSGRSSQNVESKTDSVCRRDVRIHSC